MEPDKVLSTNPSEYLLKQAEHFHLKVNNEEFAKTMDKNDPLHNMRSKFLIPKHKNGEDILYFCGNSLGLQPKGTRKYLEEELKEWEEKGVEGHFNHSKSRPWVTTDEYVLEQMRHIVGAEKEEVAVMNSLSVNIHLMMVPFYRPTPQRYKIMIEAKSFPSDLYIAQSQLKFHGYDHKEALIQLKPRENEETFRTEDIIKYIEEHGREIALILWPGVQYYTGQYFDIEKITEAAHKQGITIGFDLAHAVGNLPLKLHDWKVDFACWCSYKYLNSGPGGIGGCFVHSKHARDSSLNRFAGWWGHELETRFQMNEPEFTPIPGAFGFRLSNPPVVCIATLLGSVELFDEATMPRLRQKSLALTGYLELLIKEEIGLQHVTIITPSDPSQRGCQLSLVFKKDVSEVSKKLEEAGVICDVRKPHVLRVAPTPLYNTFSDVLKFVMILKKLLFE